MLRNKDIEQQYVGMIPSSLELNKLVSSGMCTFKNKTSDKLLSDDIINVKFKRNVKAAEDTIRALKNKISTSLNPIQAENSNNDLTEKQKERKEIKRQNLLNYISKLEDFISTVETEAHLDKWKEVNIDKLREQLYINGFILKSVNTKTGEITENKYVVYKRSSAKSRVGQCLFIKEHLFNDMISWSRMGLPLQNVKIDYPSLLAYESLVGSSLEDTIAIDPKNILIVSDVESHFNQECNVIRTGANGYLDSFQERVNIKNSLFDGESLLDSDYFSEGKSMKLLRNHMFKSAAFNCCIQKYLIDKCPLEIDYSEWEVKNMFGERMFAKDIHLIITPSSLKALKFSNVFGSGQEAELEMWKYWKMIVADNGNLFGVCKSEKQSKLGADESGRTLQQLSYQMVNSLPMTQRDMNKLVVFENDYINRLKNDDDFFIEHVRKAISNTNSNAMMVSLYEHNNEITRIKMFRDFRKKEIFNHSEYIKRGKIRLHGDYAVMLGNPMEYLDHAIGCFDPSSYALKTNEVFTMMFEADKLLVGFRNPHTSPSNVLVAKNTYNKDIMKYFNLSDNIVCVNAIDFPLQDILSGCDYDSDTLLLIDNELVLELAEKCFGKYRVCINDVRSSKKDYQLNNRDMALIDNQLSTSQRNIGTVVNTGQLLMSTYWDLISKGETMTSLSELLKKIDVMTVLSGICIDLAKKMYNIDINKEISYAKKTKELSGKYPLFWKYVKKKKSDLLKRNKYFTPMDFLYEEIDSENADRKKNMGLEDLLEKKEKNNADRKQQEKIEEYVSEMCGKINSIKGSSYKKSLGEEEDEEEKVAIDNIIKYYKFYIEKLTVKEDTMNAILLKIAKNKSDNNRRLMNVLYQTQRDTFINAFKKQKSPQKLNKKCINT
ncbi:hypothetical protein [Paenibacillus radicibacter]|uniref:hypothetical protein n=1 Tax=Paenibacillus radicibacter TaxID=2972488 RepID=UPI0021595293|nr:hypothetical protein [Paenibacillus radicibacter]